MPEEKNIIYPEPEKILPSLKRWQIFLATVAIAAVGTYYWFSLRPQEASPPPPIQGDVSIQAGFFTVSQSERRITIKQGDTKAIKVAVKLIPLENFKETVSFSIQDILQSGRSIKNERMLRAEFNPIKSETESMLAITPSKELEKGDYTIIYAVSGKSIRKTYNVMVKVE